MDWNQLLDIAKKFFDSGLFQFAKSSIVHDSLYQLSEFPLQGSLDSPESRTLLRLLYTNRQSQASDNRDKIFALLGIASDRDKWYYISDYTKSVTEVYVEFAIQEMCKHGNADLLTHCSMPDNTEIHVPLPSWVPDWSRVLPTNSSPIIAVDVYCAGGDTSFSGRIGDEEGTLLVDGLFLGSVDRMGRSTVEEQLNAMTSGDQYIGVKMKCERMDECFDIAATSKALEYEHRTACIRAMVANKDSNGDRLDISNSDLGTKYEAYRTFADKTIEIMGPEKMGAGFDALWEQFSLTMHSDVWFERTFDQATFGRRFCLFSDGRIGYVPEKAELGDKVIIFLGGTVPILLRPFGDSFIVVGESYVHGMMEGEAFEDPDVRIHTIMLR